MHTGQRQPFFLQQRPQKQPHFQPRTDGWICNQQRATNLEKERSQKRSDKKKRGRTETLLAFFSSLQVTLFLTANAKGKRRQSRAGSTSCLGLSAAARGTDAPPRVLQFQKCSSTIPGFFRGYFVNLKLCNVIFV